MALTLAIKVGLSEMKPNTPSLAITTDLISCSPGPIRRYHYPINIAAQLYGELLGFTRCVQPNLPSCSARLSASSYTRWQEQG